MSMQVVVYGMNHRSAPLEVREKLDFTKYAAQDYLPRLVSDPSVAGGMVLSTCNRVEVYLTGSSQEALMQRATTFLKEYHGVENGTLEKHAYEKVQRDAILHLFSVTSSLDSMAVGEPQILGQVKKAYQAAAEAKTTDVYLDRLCQKAFSVAKRVRTQTKISQQAVSISSAAVELAQKIFGSLENQKAMVVGAGEMAVLAAKHLRKKGVEKLFFTNRSFAKAVELAQTYDGLAVSFDRWVDHWPEADVTIVSTSSCDHILTEPQAKAALTQRRFRPIFVVDLSVPRNVDPKVDGLEHVYLYDLDDLQGVVESNVRFRAEEAKGAQMIVELETDQFFRCCSKLDVATVIRDLVGRFEDLRVEELHRLRARLGELSPKQWDLIETTTSSLVQKLLSNPIAYLQQGAVAGQCQEREGAVREVFSLGPRTEPEDEVD